jgi:ABC-type glycerol-3-phosphate transport system substrate-binding protein
MTMNRKTMAFAATIAATLGLAACSSGGSSGGGSTGAGAVPTDTPITLQIMDATVVADPEMTVEKRIAADFTKAHPNITIEFTGVNYNDYATKLTTVATSHNMPDIFTDGPELSAKVEMFGVSTDLTQLLGSDFIKGFDQNDLKDSYVGKKLAYVPYYTIPMSLIYRTDLFEAAGLTPPKTWDEFVTDAQKLTVDAKGTGQISQWGFAMVGTADGSGGARFVPAMRTFGGQELVQKSGGTWASEINSSGGIAALQLWGDLVNKYKVVPPGALTANYPAAVNEMASGQAAMMLSGTNGLGAILAQAPNLKGKLATAPIPTVPGSSTVTVLGQQGFAISNTSKNQAAAAEYIKFFLSKDNQVAWTQATGRLPVRTDALSALKLSDPMYAGAVESTKYTISLPQVSYYPAVQLDAAKAFQAVISGTPAAEAAKNAQDQINKLVADNG